MAWFIATKLIPSGSMTRLADPYQDRIFSVTGIQLDLGRVEVIAGVKLNGKNLGILWVNLHIGDEQLPSDVQSAGMPLAKWPDWLVKHEPRPSKERVTFTTWHHWQKIEALKPSWLIGPILLCHYTIIPLKE